MTNVDQLLQTVIASVARGNSMKVVADTVLDMLEDYGLDNAGTREGDVQEETVTIELTSREQEVLAKMLDTIFSSVRSGKVDAVKQVAGIESMTDAAHLISVRNALGK